MMRETEGENCQLVDTRRGRAAHVKRSEAARSAACLGIMAVSYRSMCSTIRLRMSAAWIASMNGEQGLRAARMVEVDSRACASITNTAACACDALNVGRFRRRLVVPVSARSRTGHRASREDGAASHYSSPTTRLATCLARQHSGQALPPPELSPLAASGRFNEPLLPNDGVATTRSQGAVQGINPSTWFYRHRCTVRINTAIQREDFSIEGTRDFAWCATLRRNRDLLEILAIFAFSFALASAVLSALLCR